jgi:hypothetical protein
MAHPKTTQKLPLLAEAAGSLPENAPTLRNWALVELFGHQRIVGMVTVDPIDLPGMVRVDVPDLLKAGEVERPGFTRYFGKSALYAVTPISEQSVRELLPHVDGHPSRPLSIGASEW